MQPLLTLVAILAAKEEVGESIKREKVHIGRSSGMDDPVIQAQDIQPADHSAKPIVAYTVRHFILSMQ